MTLSASATHALRAVAWLAERERRAPARRGAPGEATLGRELAREVKVPSHYLAKVLATLARAGVLTASRGVRGGYRLARPAHRIRLIDVVEPFEGKRARPGCLLRPGRPCTDSGACSAHGAWSRVNKTYLGFLEKTTVADIRGD
jgi:Rrf2 family protein